MNQEQKDKWISIMQEHQDADRLIQGRWLDENNRGCFFGCAMQTNSNPLEKAIEAMDLPSWLVYLAEKIFEGLPLDQAVLFPVQLLKAIPVYADLEPVRHKIAIKRLTPLIKDSNGDEVNNAIKQVIEYHNNPCEVKRLTARSAAWSAWSTELSESAVWSIESAAWSTEGLEARSAETVGQIKSVWIQERDNLIKALRSE